MALIDRIKHDGPPDEIVWKYEKENITLGGQLIVNESQEVLFFKDGQALDLFGPGNHTISSKNLPLLGKIVNLPFGGHTPFTAEVWFINKVAKLDYKWGTLTPAPIMDPEFKVMISVGAFGQYGLQVADSRQFVTQIVGTMPRWESAAILQYFKDIIVNSVKDSIAKFLINKKISISTVTAYLDDLSKIGFDRIKVEFDRYGIDLLKFTITSITIPDEEIKKIQKVGFDVFEVRQLGDKYQMKRSLDVMQTAAGNPGAVGSLMSAGIGLGVGAQMARGVSQVAHDVGSQVQGAQSPQEQATPQTGRGTTKCPKCQADIPAGVHFCYSCGTKIDEAKLCHCCCSPLALSANYCGNCGAKVEMLKCSRCGFELAQGMKFCSNCGKEVGT